MKHILMACGTGMCTSSCVRDHIEHFLDTSGYAGKYDVTQAKMADVPKLQANHDFLIAITMMPATLDIPFVDGVPFLTGKDCTQQEAEILELMGSNL